MKSTRRRSWETLPHSELLFYEGLHGGVTTEKVDIARHVDLLIGVVPVINLEWIQKLHRDKNTRGYSTEAVTDVILRRMVGPGADQGTPTSVTHGRDAPVAPSP